MTGHERALKYFKGQHKAWKGHVEEVYYEIALDALASAAALPIPRIMEISENWMVDHFKHDKRDRGNLLGILAHRLKLADAITNGVKE